MFDGAVVQPAHIALPGGQEVGRVHVHELDDGVTVPVGEIMQPVGEVGGGAAFIDDGGRMVSFAQSRDFGGRVSGAVENPQQLRGYGAIVVDDARR